MHEDHRGVKRLLRARWLRRLRGQGSGAVLIRGSSGSFVAKGFAAIAGFGLHVVLARMLGAVAYGDFTYAFTWMVVLAAISRFGFDRASVRYVASYEETRRWEHLRGILRFSVQRVWLASIAVALVASAVVAWRAGRQSPELTRTFYVGLACLPLIAAVGLRESHLTGFRHPVLAALPFALIRPLVTVAIFVAAALLLAPATAEMAMGITGIGTLCALIFAISALRRLAPAGLRGVRSDTGPRAEWIETALPLMVAMAMAMIAQRASILLTGMLAGSQAVGFLSAAMRYSDLLLFAQQAVASLATPMFAAIYARGEHGQLQRVLSLSTLAAAAFALPLGLLLILFRGTALHVFGAGFDSASLALVCLVCGQLTNSFSGLVGNLLAMTGHHRIVARVISLAAVVSVLLNLLLIPRYGITGAAIATAVTIALQNLLLAISVHRKLGVSPTLFGIRYLWSR